jgi:hypothetical protein
VPRCEISASEGCRRSSIIYAEYARVVRQPTAFFYFRGVMDAKGLARQLQQVHCSAHSSLKKNINSINQ